VHLGQVRNRYDKFAALDTEIITVSNDPLDKLAAHVEKKGREFYMLSDADGKVIKQYDLKNSWELFHHGAPHPATYIIDREGIVRFADVRQVFVIRTTISTMLAELEAVNRKP
jgi:peroxiredoxin